MDPVEDLVSEVRMRRRLSPDVARTIRRRAGVTQARMAQALEIDRTTLARWEAGTIRPPAAQQERWTQLLERLEQEVAVA